MNTKPSNSNAPRSAPLHFMVFSMSCFLCFPFSLAETSRAPGEGCLVLDFGHVAARGGGSSEDVQLQLRGAQVLGVTSNSRRSVKV